MAQGSARSAFWKTVHVHGSVFWRRYIALLAKHGYSDPVLLLGQYLADVCECGEVLHEFCAKRLENKRHVGHLIVALNYTSLSVTLCDIRMPRTATGPPGHSCQVGRRIDATARGATPTTHAVVELQRREKQTDYGRPLVPHSDTVFRLHHRPLWYFEVRGVCNTRTGGLDSQILLRTSPFPVRKLHGYGGPVKAVPRPVASAFVG